MIADEPFGVDALVDAWVFAERDGLLYVDFNLVTAADEPVLTRIRERHGRLLADEYLARWDSTIGPALASYDLGTVQHDIFAYIMISAFSLDWDGLDYTVERGWRQEAAERPNGDRFAVWAEYRAEPDALKGLFWGSHNTTQRGVRVTTFGDHYAVPRNGFPDLAWRLNVDFDQLDEAEEDALYPGSAVVARDGALDWVAGVMTVLRDGPRSTADLARALDRPVSRTGYAVGMLEELGYVVETPEGWAAAIPVLDDRDVPVTRAVLRAGRKAMAAWGEAHMGEVFREMEDLVAVRQGVAPELMMTKMWHHIFAGANAVLIEEGLLADPYAEDARFRGFFPAVWTVANRPATVLGSG